jgi:hypothetical protein
VAQEDSILQLQLNMQRVTAIDRTVPYEQAARAPNGSEPALNVVTLYQDPLTRHWAAELWGRVGQLIHCGDICHKSWRLSDLSQADVFADAVQAAARADVLVISVRDEGELPPFLHKWIEAWMPKRAGLEGALVALLGVPALQGAQSDRAYHCLEAVARSAGLDFLPRERKLPEKLLAGSTSIEVSPVANPAVSWPSGASLHYQLSE